MTTLEEPQLTITPESVAMAEAVLRGDAVAVCALADWVVEQRLRPVGRFSVRYTENLETVIAQVLQKLRNECSQVRYGGYGLSTGDYKYLVALCEGTRIHGGELQRNW